MLRERKSETGEGGGGFVEYDAKMISETFHAVLLLPILLYRYSVDHDFMNFRVNI